MSWTVELNEIPPPFFAENVMFGGLLLVLIPHVYSSRSSSSLVRWKGGIFKKAWIEAYKVRQLYFQLEGRLQRLSQLCRPSNRMKWERNSPAMEAMEAMEAMPEVLAWAYR